MIICSKAGNFVKFKNYIKVDKDLLVKVYNFKYSGRVGPPIRPPFGTYRRPKYHEDDVHASAPKLVYF